MTSTIETDRPVAQDEPRALSRKPTGGDAWFRGSLTAVGGFVLVVTGAIGIFLGYQLVPTLHNYGWKFLSTSAFNPSQNSFGILGAIIGSVVIAFIALVFAVPLALAMALYITEYAPRRLKSFLIAFVDLMAAIPSLIFGAWGFFQLMPAIVGLSHWLQTWLGWIPIFNVPGVDPRQPQTTSYRYLQSPFVAGMVVAMMVIPLATSVMRNVFDQAPVGEREGAFALGATRWGVIRSVVIPFGRGGIIGGTMLGLGRALGETVAVLFLLSPDYQLKVSITDHGGLTISSLVANNFGDAPPGSPLNSLLAAGFVLFVMTLVVNTVAAVIVSRSRSGAGVD